MFDGDIYKCIKQTEATTPESVNFQPISNNKLSDRLDNLRSINYNVRNIKGVDLNTIKSPGHYGVGTNRHKCINTPDEFASQNYIFYLNVYLYYYVWQEFYNINGIKFTRVYNADTRTWSSWNNISSS